MSRKVVRAQYIVEDYFVIPENIDLDNTNQVKDWGVKWNVMHIYFVNGEELEIKSQGYKDDFDFKRPMECFYEEAEDSGFDEDHEDFKPVDLGKMSNVKPEPEPEPERIVVKKIIVDGKKYLKAIKTGIIYDYDVYVKEGEQVLVGKWNEEKQNIDFNTEVNDKIDTMLEKYDASVINKPKVEDIIKKMHEHKIDNDLLNELFKNIN
jgi:hypothetical protein